MSADNDNQFAPPKSSVADVSTAAGGFSKAGRGARLGAVMLDGLIGTVAFIPSYFLTFGLLAARSPRTPLSTFRLWGLMAQTGGWFFLGVAGALIVLGINIYLMRKSGQTIGKKLVGIRIVGTDGSHVPLSRIFFIRYVLNAVLTLIPVIGSLYSLVDALMIFGEQRRCVHDYMADTIVIDA